MASSAAVYKRENNAIVFLDISIGNEFVGRLIIEVSLIEYRIVVAQIRSSGLMWCRRRRKIFVYFVPVKPVIHKMGASCRTKDGK